MTVPLLRGLRRDHPSAEISLMVMDAFADAPVPSRLYDRLLRFPLQGLTRTLVANAPEWSPALEELRTFIRESVSQPFDLAINLDHTDTSALVMALVPAARRSGLFQRPNRARSISGPWMTYLRASARSREFTAFHLVDLFSWAGGVARDSAGLDIELALAERNWASEFLAAHSVSSRPLIAMMLGASSESKRWPADRFAALADALEPDLGDIVLVGGPGERELASVFRKAVRRPVVDATGETTIRGLAALLERCRLLVTNDTGPMHMATAVGTRVIDISSGPVSAHETGPYGDGHLVIEPSLACFPCPFGSTCHHFACRLTLSVPDAAAVVRFAMDAGPVPALTDARVLRGQRARASGRIEFVPIGSRRTLADHVRSAAATVWEQSLGAPGRAGAGWSDAPVDSRANAGDAERVAAIREILHGVASESRAAAAALKNIPRSSPARCQAISDSVHAGLLRLLAAGESDRAVHALVAYLRNEIESLAPGDAMAMSRAQTAAYTGTALRAARLADVLAA